ncbi:MAG: TolC family protein [Armatimonadetes bacterium]|nr:TolC family protein [Armatimonadota bacterium]
MALVICATLVLVIGSAVPAPAQAPAPAPPAPRTLTLREALTIAVQQNPQLRAAAFEVQIARTQLAQAKAAAAGQLNAQASYTRTAEQPPTTVVIGSETVTIPAPSPNQYDLRLVFQYPLYTGGRIEAQVALAEANVKGAEATLQRQVQQVAFEVRQAYFRVLLAQAGLEVAERGIQQASENLRVARVRVAAGASPRFDEIQADVAVANARQSQVRSRNAVALAVQGLNALLGLALDTPLALREGFITDPVQTPLEQLIAAAQASRPELTELQARQAAAQAAIQLAESGAKPTVGVTTSGSYGTVGGLFTTGASANWSVMLAATLNLYDGGITRERVREAQLRLEQTKAVEAQTRQAIELDVRQAYLNLQAAREELGGADALVTQATEAQRIAIVRFQSGVGTNLEVITAQATASQAEGSRAQALFNFSVARAALERAVGAEVR